MRFSSIGIQSKAPAKIGTLTCSLACSYCCECRCELSCWSAAACVCGCVVRWERCALPPASLRAADTTSTLMLQVLVCSLRFNTTLCFWLLIPEPHSSFCSAKTRCFAISALSARPLPELSHYHRHHHYHHHLTTTQRLDLHVLWRRACSAVGAVWRLFAWLCECRWWG